MALIKYGVAVSAIAGKVGGVVFKQSLGGATLQSNRSYKRTVNQTSVNNQRSTNPFGIGMIDALKWCARYWKTLTILQKASWLAAAPNFPLVNKLGVVSKPSGYHLFQHINIRLYFTTGAIVLVPPANTVGALPVAFTITSLSTTTVTINIPGSVPSGYLMYIKAGPSISAGIKPEQNYFTIVNYIAAATTGSVNSIINYQNKYGKPIVGNTIWVETVLSNLLTGELGAPYQQAAIVT